MPLPTDSAAANPRAAGAPAWQDRWRLFFALDPSPALRRQIVAHEGAWRWSPEARLSPADKLHLTLVFMAGVDPRHVPRLLRAGAQVAAAARGCTLCLDRAAVWPGGIAHLAPSKVPEAAQALHDALLMAALHAQVDAERRAWHPHLTLARKAQHAQPPLDFAELRWQARGFSLQRSLLGSGRYETLGRWRIGAGADDRPAVAV